MSDIQDEYRPRCKNFYCKSMIVFGENFREDPDFQAGLSDSWCVRTSRDQGPDGDEVSLDACSNPERPCFEEY